jgi:hypothetical protein
VTLAHATLNRIGSASNVGMAQHTKRSVIRETPDGSPQTLRELGTTIAEKYGELRENLQAMQQENAWDHTQQRDAVVFNIQGRNVQYSTPYAICYAYPALKIGERYFKLDEVKL